MRGQMLWFNEAKGYGLIETGTGERVYVHQSGFLPGEVTVGRCKGLEVDSPLGSDAGEDVATGVPRSPKIDQRRTTRHHNARTTG